MRRHFISAIFITLSIILLTFSARPSFAVPSISLDVYTQKGGQGPSVEGGTFGLGEAVRLIVQLDVPLPDTVEGASKFFRTQVDFHVTNPDGSLLLSRLEQVDLNGQSIIAFMIPINATAGTFKATATYDYQSQTATDFLTFHVESDYSVEKMTKSGIITSNETWSGTVRITGDVSVPEGATVTVLPGTTVFFSAHSDDQADGSAVPLDEWIAQHPDPTWTEAWGKSHCQVDGRLMARGLPDKMIIFTSDSLTPDGADWVQIHMYRGSIFEYCVVEYARGALDIAENTGSSVIVSHNILRHSLWTGLTAHGSTTDSPTITYNLIYDAGGHQGLATTGTNAQVGYNVIYHCRDGIHIDANAFVYNNILIDNGVGILLSEEAGVLQYNTIIAPLGDPYNYTYQGESIYPAVKQEDRMGIVVVHSSPTITNNIIAHNPTGLSILGDSSAIISYNTITNCSSTTILFAPSFSGDPQIYGNSLCNNSHQMTLQNSNSVNASNNWWDTTNVEEIEQKILHYYDDPALGTVLYQPFKEDIVRTGSSVIASIINPHVTLNEAVAVSGAMGPSRGAATIALTYIKPDTSTITKTLETNFAGHFNDTFKPDMQGFWAMYASWEGDDVIIGSTSPTVTFTVTKIPTTLSCSVSPSELTIGDFVIVSGSINLSVSDATVTLIYTKPNSSTVTTASITDSEGDYSDIYTPNTVGFWSVAASWDGDSIHEGASSSEVGFTVSKISSSITCEVSSSSLIIGDSVTVYGSINPALSGKIVTLTYEKTDRIPPSFTRTVTTGSDGSFSDSYTLDASGAWSVTVSWDGDSIYESASSTTESFEVKEKDIPWMFYGAIASIPVIAIGLFFLLRRKSTLI